ncbi:MAG: AbrB/MazE/SpoVT family DNA-binding domain-containing protein [Planctomycetia bacterium]|nr:AbrB/MazE/SpoVT family DNA-binding domain-containing protein [Planctomycetia bacterium]
MTKHLRKVGNSTALLLDKPILELLGIHEGDAVNLTVTNGSLVVTPLNPRAISDAEFNESLDRVINDWGDVLKRLA